MSKAKTKTKTEEPEADTSQTARTRPRAQSWTPQVDDVHPRRDAGSPPPSVPPVILPQGVDDNHPRRGS
jgi:hypothetical protein